MSGLFEHLAANDEMGRIARRKAIAVANKRVADRFGEFLTDSDAETVTERLDLVGEEFDNAIRDACDEQGVEDHEPIIASVRSSFLKKKLANGGRSLSEGEECSNCNMVQEDDVDECPRCRGAQDAHALGMGPPGMEPALGPHKGPVTYGERNGVPWYRDHEGITHRGSVKEARECEDCGDKIDRSDYDLDPDDFGGDQDPLETGSKSCKACRDANARDDADWERMKNSGFDKEARRPKMCPYHKELVNASLQVGEPQYAAFAPLVGGDSHCGGGYEDKCNFKPPMVTQSYWDQKETERLERKEQRELAQQGEQSHELEAPMVEETFDEPTDQATLAELDDAPSAVGDWEVSMDSVEAESPEPVLASHNASWEVTAVSDGDSWVKNEKVEQPEGPSPKIDKKQWNGLEPINTDAGPYKTVHQDVPDRPDYSKTDSLGQATKDAVLEQTKAVTTEETLPTADDNAGFNTDKNVDGAENTKTFPDKGQADPVTPHTMSSTDALNMHTADLLGDIGDVANDATNFVTNPAGTMINKGLDAAGLPTVPTPLDMAGDAAKGFMNAAEGAGAAVNDYILGPLGEMPPESTLQGDPFGGNRPIGPDGKEISPEELKDMIGNPPPVEVSAPINKGGSITSAAHTVKEEDGKFFVIEDGDEKAAGPFATEEAAKKRANELNDMENLEKGSKKKLTDSEKVNKELAEASDQIDDEVLGKLPNSKAKTADQRREQRWTDQASLTPRLAPARCAECGEARNPQTALGCNNKECAKYGEADPLTPRQHRELDRAGIGDNDNKFWAEDERYGEDHDYRDPDFDPENPPSL